MHKTNTFRWQGRRKKNLENLGINELHKNWCYEYITNEVRFVLLAAVIIKPFNTIRIISSTNFNAQFSLLISNMFVTLLSSTCFEH